MRYKLSINRSNRPRGSPRCWLGVLLVWALALAPLLHQMHRVAHARALEHRHAALHATLHVDGHGTHPAAAHGDAHAHHASWLHALFDGHASSDCQWLDCLHATAANAPPPPGLALCHRPQGPVAQPRARAWRGELPLCFFDARAPPPAALVLRKL